MGEHPRFVKPADPTSYMDCPDFPVLSEEFFMPLNPNHAFQLLTIQVLNSGYFQHLLQVQ